MLKLALNTYRSLIILPFKSEYWWLSVTVFIKPGHFHKVGPFLQNNPPWYNWNIVESGILHHKPQTLLQNNYFAVIWHAIFEVGSYFIYSTWKNKECKKKSLELPSVLGKDNFDGWLGYNIQTENIDGERFIFLRKSDLFMNFIHIMRWENHIFVRNILQ